MLQTLISCEMLSLEALEEADLDKDDFCRIAGNYAAALDREAAGLTADPERWLPSLCNLLNVQDDYGLAVAGKSRRQGHPPIEQELAVAMHVTAALIRGHLDPERSV